MFAQNIPCDMGPMPRERPLIVFSSSNLVYVNGRPGTCHNTSGDTLENGGKRQIHATRVQDNCHLPWLVHLELGGGGTSRRFTENALE